MALRATYFQTNLLMDPVVGALSVIVKVCVIFGKPSFAALVASGQSVQLPPAISPSDNLQFILSASCPRWPLDK